MTITKHKTKEITYYECNPVKGVTLFAFTKRRLLIDLFNIYKISLFNPINVN